MADLPIIQKDKTIKDAMKEINDIGYGIVFVVKDNNKFIGLLSDGDIRRALLNGIRLNEKVNRIMIVDCIKIYNSWSNEKIQNYLNQPEIKRKIPKLKALIIPILDQNEILIGIKSIFRKEASYIFQELPQKATPNKILVIGGAGYIGSVLVRDLLELDYNVKVFDNLLYGDHGIKDLYSNEKFELFQGDITNISDIVEAMSDVDAVVHLAAIVGDPAGKLKPKETLKINYFSTRTLGEVAKYLGLSKFVMASTCSVYGFQEEKCKENSNTNPLSLYAETKLISEQSLLDLTGDGFSPTILRFATAFGLSYRMRFDLVVNLLIAKAFIDKEITVFGQGTQIRPFVHIKDISYAIIKVLEANNEKISGEIFNVGSERLNLSIKKLSKIIKKRVPGSQLNFIKEQEDDRSYNVSFEKIEEALGFRPKYSIERAVEEIKNAFKNQRIKFPYTDKTYNNFKSLKEG